MSKPPGDASYRHAVGMLQVKNLPDELHAALSERARSEGTTMSEYVTRLIARDLVRPTIDEWIAEQRNQGPSIDIEVAATMDAIRTEYDPVESPATAATGATSPRRR